MANASLGGAVGSMAELYKAIDVLIGGGPLVLDPSCGYDYYRIYKFHHTVPIYILYVTICDQIDISVHTRVPLPGLRKGFDSGLTHLSEAVAKPAATPAAKPAAKPAAEPTTSKYDCTASRSLATPSTLESM